MYTNWYIYRTVPSQVLQAVFHLASDVYVGSGGSFDGLFSRAQIKPTLEDMKKMKIESGTQPNSIIKLKGRGLPRQNSGRRGDQYIHVVVEIPKKLSKEQKDLLQQFKESD